MTHDATDDLNSFLAEMSHDVDFRDDLEDAREISRALRELKAMREAANIRQKDVAKLMGTSPSVISNIENEVHDARWTTLASYARAVGGRLCLRVADASTPKHALDLASWRPSKPTMTVTFRAAERGTSHSAVRLFAECTA